MDAILPSRFDRRFVLIAGKQTDLLARIREAGTLFLWALNDSDNIRVG